MLIVTYLFCSCQRRVNLSPCTHAGVAPPPTSQRLIPSCSSSRVAHHVDCHLSFLFLPTAGESSALPPCWCHPTAKVSTTLPISFIIEGEKLPQRTLIVVDNVAFEDRHSSSRSTCGWMDRSRRLSPFTSCGIVFILLLLVVDAGVVSSLPRLAPFDALIIDEGGGGGRIVPAGVGRRCPLPSLLLLFPSKPAALSSPRRTSTGISSTPDASDRRGRRRRRRSLPQLLCSFSSIAFTPADSSFRSSSSAPDDGPA